MKKTSFLSSIFLILGLGIYSFINTSYSLGFSSYSNTTCPTCHSASAPTTSIAINGLPTFYNLNQAYPISVTITNASKLIAGFQLRSNIGTFSTTDPSISIYADNRSAGHNVPKGMTGGSATFNLVWTAPASGSTAANFGAQGIGADGTGSTNNDSGVFTTVSNIALPIVLSNLKAYIEEDQVAILFKTSDEQNVAQIEVQKSTNGIDFETLEIHSPKGGGLYTSYDQDIENGKTYFYRLMETSLDNKISYSEIISLSYKTAEELTIYPTLVKNNTLYFKGLEETETYTFSLHTLSGQVVRSQELITNSVQVGDLPKGFYLASLRNNRGILLTERVQIQ